MVHIQKDKELSILVGFIFVLAFLGFLLMNPNPTGNVIKDIIDVDSTQTGPLTGHVSIKASASDILPCNDSANIFLLIKDSTSAIVQSSSMTFHDFLSKAGKDCSSGEDQKFNDQDNNFAWEGLSGQIGKGFVVGSTATYINVSLSEFSGLTDINTAGTYTLEFGLNYSTDIITSDTKSFTLTDTPSGTSPTLESISFKNLNNSNKFIINDYINCSALVKDSDSSSVTVKYVFWNKTSFSNKLKEGDTTCVGTSWTPSDGGKTCVASVQVTNSWIGDWYCTLIASDDTLNQVYVNSTALTMMNAYPVVKEKFSNLTFKKNKNYTNINLDDYFSDPDGQTLKYSFRGNSSISVFIEDGSELELVPKIDWTGLNSITFYANDSYNLTVSSVLNVNVSSYSCITNWTCTNFSSCINGTHIRTCTDINHCDSIENRPTLNESCTSSSTCSSGDGCKIDCSSGDSDCNCLIENGHTCGTDQTCNGVQLKHASTGICCSQICTTPVTTINTATTPAVGAESGFGDNTNKVVIGVSIIAAVIFVMILIIIIYTFIQRKRAGVEEPVEPAKEPSKEPTTIIVKHQFETEKSAVKVRPINLEKMKEYIVRALELKTPIKTIKEELERAGWPQSDIERELSIARLANYIQMKINQGVPKEQIISSLRIKGWKEEQIREAIKETKIKPLF